VNKQNWPSEVVIECLLTQALETATRELIAVLEKESVYGSEQGDIQIKHYTHTRAIIRGLKARMNVGPLKDLSLIEETAIITFGKENLNFRDHYLWIR
jgi:hypothetical protein